MAAGSADEFVVVAPEFQSFLHLQITQPPVPVLVVEILVTILEEDADVPLVFLANEGGVNVPSPDVGEAADMADYVLEEVGAFPGHGEGTDSSGAHSADGSAGRISGELVGFADLGKDFFFQKLGILRAEGVVFDAAVASLLVLPPLPALDLVGEETWIDEDADGQGDFLGGVKVVEDDGRPNESLFIDVGMTVLEDNDVGIFCPIILGGDVEVILAKGAFKDLACPIVAGDRSFGNSFLALGLGGEFVVFGKGGKNQETGGEEKLQHGTCIAIPPAM